MTAILEGVAGLAGLLIFASGTISSARTRAATSAATQVLQQQQITILSDRIVEAKAPSFDELKTCFSKSRGGSVELENRGEVKEPTRQAGDYDGFEGMDFGEFKGQGSRQATSTLQIKSQSMEDESLSQTCSLIHRDLDYFDSILLRRFNKLNAEEQEGVERNSGTKCYDY
jgi:hypothetical protein